MPKATLLDSRIHEVIRTLPPAQADEILRQDTALYEGAQGIEFGVLYQTPGIRGMDDTPRLLHTYIPQVASKLAWEGLSIAEQYDFPALSPKRAMYLGRTTTAAVETIHAVAPTIPKEEFIKLASSIVGLHGAVIGSEEVLKTDQDAQALLAGAVRALRDNFVRTLYLGKRRRY